MKINYKYLLIALSIATLCGCQNRKYSSSYSNVSTFEEEPMGIVDMGEFAPDPGYTPDLRNRNNLMYLELNLEPINKKTTPVPDGINAISIKNTLQNEFEKSKRFSMLSPEKAKDASIRLRVDANIVYSEVLTASRKAIGYEVRMAFTGYNPDGIQEFGLNVKGGGAEYFDKRFTGGFVIAASTTERLLMSCVDKCFDEVFPALCKRYPIAGNVQSCRDSGSRVIVTFDRDENDGIKQGMPFIIGYTDEDNNQIFVAKGRASAVSSNGTQIVVEKWNADEKFAVDLCKEKIKLRDKHFIENMFVVSKYRPTLRK